jgi:hypothetical protein
MWMYVDADPDELRYRSTCTPVPDKLKYSVYSGVLRVLELRHTYHTPHCLLY